MRLCYRLVGNKSTNYSFIFASHENWIKAIIKCREKVRVTSAMLRYIFHG